MLAYIIVISSCCVWKLQKHSTHSLSKIQESPSPSDLPLLSLTEPVKGLKLEWTSRFNIALGTAQGLAHLHSKSESCMVHSDIKATHILLDQKLGPKIADFGLAQLLQNDAEKLHTFVDGTRYTKHHQLQFSLLLCLIHMSYPLSGPENTVISCSDITLFHIW